MAKLTLDTSETSLVADLMESLRTSTDWPIPFMALHQLADLLHADVVAFQAMDTLLGRVYAHRAVDPDGEGDAGETVTEARKNPFWETYWTSACSYPDRTGDYESVTLASDFASMRQRRNEKPLGTPIVSMRACLPGRSLGRHSRVVAWRYDDVDFDERERFLLALLRPHVERANRANLGRDRQPPPLTRRQLELLALVRLGMTNVQIAHRLELSEGTVRTHLNNIYERLGTSGRTAAVHAVFGPSDDWPMEA